MKTKILLLFGIILITLCGYGQYSENKLPSGLTVADTASDADYTIIQYDGEAIVKAIRMDSLRSYMTQYMNEDMPTAVTYSGSVVLSDGSRWLNSSRVYVDGTSVLNIGTGTTAALSAYNLNISAPALPNTQGGAYSLTAGANNQNYGLSSIVVGQSNVLQRNDDFNISSIFGVSCTANANGVHLKGLNLYGNSYGETVIGRLNDSVAGANRYSWISTDRLFTIGNGASVGAESNALVMLKNGNTTATGDWTIDGDLTVTGMIDAATLPHNFLYFGDSTVTYTFAVADTWYHLTNATDSLWVQDELEEFTVANDTITVGQSGDYDLDFHLSFEGTNGTTYAVRFYNVTQGVGIPVASANTGRGAGNVISLTIIAYSQLTAGDEIVLQIKADATNDAILKNSTIRMKYIHE